MKQSQKNQLLEDIENLRRKLNGQVEAGQSVPRNCEQTYALSCQLDKLICKYMKAIHLE
ncbi:MAG: aspartyl-phosphate phosphatase Spo0E family protein [Firmicutes bacterium]|nr:aspartyl-phosphate phosphatase Spo0E family protein [Bacillota bacterium]